MVNAQEYLHNNYLKNITYLKIDSTKEKLTGTLDLSEFTNLKWISIPKQELTSLTLNSPHLEVINLSDNKIRSLSWLNTLPNKNSLTKLHLFNNEITDIDFNLLTSFPNLTSINLGANPLNFIHLEDLTTDQSILLKDWIDNQKLSITSLKGNLLLNLLEQNLELKEENEELRRGLEQKEEPTQEVVNNEIEIQTDLTSERVEKMERVVEQLRQIQIPPK